MAVVSTLDRGTVSIVNSTVSGNHADTQAGGIINLGAVLTIEYSTIVGNDAALRRFRRRDRCARPLLHHDHRSQQGANCGFGPGPAALSNGSNLSSDATCGFTAASDQQNVDPNIGPLQANGGPTRTHALLTGGPRPSTGSATAARWPPTSAVARTTDGDGDGVNRCDIRRLSVLPARRRQPPRRPRR